MFEIPEDIEEREPSFEGPLGQAWMLQAEELGIAAETEFVLRAFDASSSMLKIGAVLGLAARVEMPNLCPITHWRAGGGKIWCAYPRIQEATRLSEASLARLSWNEAIELWRPLANAIKSLHAKGVVHGQINPHSVWHDSAASRLVAADGATWIIHRPDGIWWAYGERPSAGDDIAALVRLLLYVHLPRGMAEQVEPDLAGVPAYAIPGVRRALLGDGFESVAELLKSLAPSPTHGVPSKESGSRSETVLFGRVHDLEEVQGNERLGKGVKFRITHPEFDESGRQSGYADARGAFFYEGAHGEVYRSVQDVWEGAELNIIDAHQVQDSRGESYYTASPRTLPVLEPHWPVTVSSVLKAEGCVSRYFVDIRDDGESSHYLVFGILLHQMLEKLAAPSQDDSQPSFEELWDAAFPDLRLAMLAAGMQDKDIGRFHADAKIHYQNIIGFTRGRGGSQNRVGWTGQNVEATRYSSVYGLEGRIDLVTEDEKAGLHIVELKSGRARDEHVSQVRCYKLLWDGIAETRDMAVTGYLLYSKEGALRSTPLDDPLRDRKLLRARNSLVAAHRALADGLDDFQLPYFMQVPRNCNAPACRFRKDRCKNQSGLLGLDPSDARLEIWPNFGADLVERARRYWRHLTRLIELENWVGNEALGEILQSGRLRERVQSFRAVSGLELVSANAEKGFVTFQGEGLKAFSTRDRVVAHREDFHRSHILRGRVTQVSRDGISIRATGVANAETLPTHGWVIDKVPVRIGYRSAHRSLYRFIQSQRKSLFQVLLEPQSGRAEMLMSGDRTTELLPETLELLNDDQIEAVAAGVSAPQGALIQGPPGTGKTTVIAHLVRELVRQNKRVVLSAQTNTAVDTMLQKVFEVDSSIEFLRIGGSRKSTRLARVIESAERDVARYFTDDLAVATESIDELAAELQRIKVFGCTTHAAAKSDPIDFLRRGKKEPVFDIAIVDEATQITEPMTLAPIVLAKRFVLVGDHRQLPPIVENDRASSHYIEGWTTPLFSEESAPAPPQVGLFDSAVDGADLSDETMGLAGLDRSLFERLVDEGVPYIMLRDQYRMHEHVMSYSSRAFYGGKLRAHKSVAGETLEVEDGQIPGGSHPVVFAHVEAESDGRINGSEAHAVVQTIRSIRESLGSAVSIGVISPFRAQGQLIRDLLEELGAQGADVDVDTVERFQGSERDVILVSLVKTDRTGEFLSDPRRLNVTLTRARKKLIIFGHRGCLELDPLFRALIHQSETHEIEWKPETV